MNIFANYEKLLEDLKKENLTWIAEEFDLLFRNKKGKCTEQDKKTAAKIIASMMTDINLLKKEFLIVDFSKTLENIEQKYPEFF